MKTIITCPFDKRLTLELDSSEVYKDDPGNGTPAMVHYREDKGTSSATYGCAVGTGEIEYFQLPERQYNWLCEQDDEVDAIIELGEKENV